MNVTFTAQIVATGETTEQLESGDQGGTKSGLSRDQVDLLRLCRKEQPLVTMMNVVGRQNRTKFRDAIVRPLIEAGLLELTIPDKPTSRLQRYRTTAAGLTVLEHPELPGIASHEE